MKTKRLFDNMYPLSMCNNSLVYVCLYYHIGQCLACTETPPTKEEYQEITRKVAFYLQGGYKDVKKQLTEKMKEEIERLNFERAQELRDQIQHIEAALEQQKVVLNDQVDRDIF